MKLIYASILVLGFLSSGAFAASNCNPATGNWVNAAPTTCRIHGNGGQSKTSVESSTEIDQPCGIGNNPDCPSCEKKA